MCDLIDGYVLGNRKPIFGVYVTIFTALLLHKMTNQKAEKLTERSIKSAAVS